MKEEIKILKDRYKNAEATIQTRISQLNEAERIKDVELKKKDELLDEEEKRYLRMAARNNKEQEQLKLKIEDQNKLIEEKDNQIQQLGQFSKKCGTVKDA